MAFHQQLLDLSCLPGNNVCAECPERNPTHASLIRARSAPCIPQALGVFVCSKCYRHHFRLGIAQVQPLQAEWTPREVIIFRRTGNEFVNGFLEALLDDPNAIENDKEIITFDEDEAEKQRLAFVKNKYVLGKYYCPETYEKKVNSKPKPTKTKATKASSAPAKLQRSNTCSAIERNCKQQPPQQDDVPATPRSAARSRRRSTMAGRRESSARQLVAHMQQQPDALLSLGEDFSDSEQDDDVDFSLSNGSDHSGTSSSGTDAPLSNLDRLRAKSLAANKETQKGKLDGFLGKTAAPTNGRRCKSVAGTSDTAPKLHSDLVYQGKVDVSLEEIRAARDAKKAARKQKRQSCKQSMSQSERRGGTRRNKSPQRVRDVEQEQASEAPKQRLRRSSTVSGEAAPKRMARRATVSERAGADRMSARERIRRAAN